MCKYKLSDVLVVGANFLSAAHTGCSTALLCKVVVSHCSRTYDIRVVDAAAPSSVWHEVAVQERAFSVLNPEAFPEAQLKTALAILN